MKKFLFFAIVVMAVVALCATFAAIYAANGEDISDSIVAPPEGATEIRSKTISEVVGVHQEYSGKYSKTHVFISFIRDGVVMEKEIKNTSLEEVQNSISNGTITLYSYHLETHFEELFVPLLLAAMVMLGLFGLLNWFFR